MEVHHRHSSGILGGGGDFKQVAEAIHHALLRRNRVDNPGEEDCGLQRIDFSPHGEPPYVEVDSDSCPDQEIRYVDLLQGGYNGDSQVFDDMEAGVEFIQGSSEETRLVHGEGCNDES